MREIEYTAQFLRDSKRESKSHKGKENQKKLFEVIDLLCADKPLPVRHRDHALSGNHLGLRECHIKPDLLLIYFKQDADVLVLVRLGSHSELF